jgi:hypothetical protein
MQDRKHFLRLAAGALALGTLFLPAAPSLAAGGQRGIISGTVVDASNAPVSDSEVLLAGPNARYKAHTDERGRFNLIGVLVNTYTLTVRKDGAVKIHQPDIAVIGDQTQDLGTIAFPALSFNR